MVIIIVRIVLKVVVEV